MLAVAACGSSSKKTATGSGSTGTTAAVSKWPAIPAGPIKLAIITAVSGANAAYCTTTKKALESVTVPEFNSPRPDGLDGHPVTITVYDYGSDVTTGVDAAT